MAEKPRSLRERLASFLLGDDALQRLIERAITAAVSVRVDDSPGWDSHTPGPLDRAWHERALDIEDALEAWRHNFFVRRIVTLTRSYVVGNGIALGSKLPEVDLFVQQFWSHPKNHLATRLGPMCNELTRSGELFPVLFTNRIDGMSYIRFVPAAHIREIETDPDDYETELSYIQVTSAEPKIWYSPTHPKASKLPRSKKRSLPPVMLHLAVNREIGCTRGEGDLTPILPWARRYSEWLKDRVRLNRQRTRQAMLDVELADDSLVQDKRQQLRTANPIEHGIYVHGPGEKTTLHALNLQADDASQDGKQLRLAIATGSSVGLHFLGEGETVNYATAREMGEPTTRFYQDRQTNFIDFLIEVATAAYQRKVALGLAPQQDNLQISATTTEVARADNESLAKAVKDVVSALAEMKAQGWIDDNTATRLAFKFAGETLTEDEITSMLKKDQKDEETERSK